MTDPADLPLSPEQQQRFDTGVAQFNGGDWFEAHETWEDLWLDLPRGPRRDFIQGLIQLAVALEHVRRRNPRGALMLVARAGKRFRFDGRGRDLGVDGRTLHATICDLLRPLHELPAEALRPRTRLDRPLPVDLTQAPRIVREADHA